MCRRNGPIHPPMSSFRFSKILGAHRRKNKNGSGSKIISSRRPFSFLPPPVGGLCFVSLVLCCFPYNKGTRNIIINAATIFTILIYFSLLLSSTFSSIIEGYLVYLPTNLPSLALFLFLRWQTWPELSVVLLTAYISTAAR